MDRSRTLLTAAFLLFFSAVSSAAEPPSAPYGTMLKNAEEALASSKKKEADFWMARYLGLAYGDPASGRSARDLDELVRLRKLTPQAFVSAEWDPGFIDWFEKGSYLRWGVDDKKVRIRQRSFEIAERRQSGYYATVVASPKLEQWHVLKDGGLQRPLLMAMGSSAEKPALFFGKILKGAASLQFTPVMLDVNRRSLHYVWKPDLYDLDGDGTPELWLRFNIAKGNGFSQILEIYRIQNDSVLKPVRRFESGDEGVARRLPDGSVELASAFDSRKANSRFHYDSHRVENWTYDRDKKEFGKASEKTVPFILGSPAWKEYFAEG